MTSKEAQLLSYFIDQTGGNLNYAIECCIATLKEAENKDALRIVLRMLYNMLFTEITEGLARKSAAEYGMDEAGVMISFDLTAATEDADVMAMNLHSAVLLRLKGMIHEQRSR